MNKLRRINTTDLTELRSILNEEMAPASAAATTVDGREGREASDNAEADSATPADERRPGRRGKHVSGRDRQPPFIITRIESKHTGPLYRAATPSQLPAATKSVHQRAIVDSERRLEQRYVQLSHVLERDILSGATALCDQSMNEARQLIHNSLAANRIVAAFVRDTARCSTTESGRAPPLEPLGQPLKQPARETAHTVWASATTDSTVTATARTKHFLDSDDPSIRQWMSAKTRQLQLQRRLKRESERIETAITAGSLAVLQRRKAEAEDAFNKWIKNKKLERKPNTETIDDEMSGSDSDAGPPQAGRQPKPRRNAFMWRSKSTVNRPKSAATFAMNRNSKMKIAGHQITPSNHEKPQESTRLLVSIDYPRPRGRTSITLVRPQTAVPQSRKMNNGSTNSQLTSQQQTEKKLRKKRRSATERLRKLKDMYEPSGEEGPQINMDPDRSSASDEGCDEQGREKGEGKLISWSPSADINIVHPHDRPDRNSTYEPSEEEGPQINMDPDHSSASDEGCNEQGREKGEGKLISWSPNGNINIVHPHDHPDRSSTYEPSEEEEPQINMDPDRSSASDEGCDEQGRETDEGKLINWSPSGEDHPEDHEVHEECHQDNISSTSDDLFEDNSLSL